MERLAKHPTLAAATLLASVILPSVTGCGGSPGGGRHPTANPAPAAILETVGDTAIIPLEVRGFDALTPAERAMAYYLVRAALPGRDIEFDRGGAGILEVRELLEEILTHPRSLDPVFRDALLGYLKRLWIHNGQHDRFTGVKFVPGFTFDDLRAGARAAQVEGAAIRLAIGEPLAAKLERLRPVIFDPEHQKERPPCAPPPARRPPRGDTPPISRREEGDRRTMRGFLAKAAAFASGPQRADLLLLGDAVTRPGPDTALRRSAGWLSLDPVLDADAGPVTGCDPGHGGAGAWRGLVWMKGAGPDPRLASLAAEARETGFLPATLLSAVGAAGPVVPPILTLSDDPTASGGHRCLLLVNVLEAGDRALLDPIIDEFAPPEDRALLRARGREASFMFAAAHAILGHGGTLPTPGSGIPSPLPAGIRGLLEEARADLRALRRLADLRPADNGAAGRAGAEDSVGAAGAPGDAEAVLRLYLARALASLRAIPSDGVPRGAQERAALLVSAWLREGGRGVVAAEVEGRTFLRMADPAAAREGVGALLAEVESLLADGPEPRAQALVERFATRVDQSLREEIAIRAARMGIPSRLGCVMPDLIPVRDAGGDVIDARIGPAGDFTLQMLRYSGTLPFEPAAAR